MRHSILILVACLGLISTGQAAVYKHVDESGKVYYSDVPAKAGQKPIKPPPITTLKSTASPASRSGSDDYKASDSKRTDTSSTASRGYSKLNISQPKNDEAIRANSGSFSLAVELEPALNTKAGHQLISLVDGKKNSSSNSTSVPVSNIERGSHSFQVQVVDKNGSVLKSSATITVHILRYSAILGR